CCMGYGVFSYILVPLVLASCIFPRRFRYGWRGASSTSAAAGQRFVFHLALSYPSPVSGEGRPERSGGRGGGDVTMRFTDRPPPGTSYRCAHAGVPALRRRAKTAPH